MTDMNREEIYRLTCKLCPNDKPGSPAFLATYQMARVKFEGELSDEKRELYEAMAKEWSENKPPPEVQRRYVHSNYSSRL